MSKLTADSSAPSCVSVAVPPLRLLMAISIETRKPRPLLGVPHVIEQSVCRFVTLIGTVALNPQGPG